MPDGVIDFGSTNSSMFDERQATNPYAREILAILDAGGYVAPTGAFVSLADAQSAAERNTVLYSPDQLAELRSLDSAGGSPPRTDVRDETTQQAALNLAAEGRVVLLNFASARDPGGGFLC